MRFNYWQFRQVGSEQWLVQPNCLRRIFVRLFGPLGVNARIRNARIIKHTLKLKLSHDARILDFGCGHAYAVFWLARYFPDYHITAIETNPDLLLAGRLISSKLGLTNIRFLEGSIDNLSEDSYYDLIFSMDVLEHIEDDESVLMAFRSAIRPDGYLLLHLPLRYQLTQKIFSAFHSYETLDHVRDEYTPDEITAKLEQAGFAIQYLRFGYGIWGELAFELNYLFWRNPVLRTFTAILTQPLSKWLGYMDIRQDYQRGNSIILLAKPTPMGAFDE